jgi:hypothetical protein
MFNDNLFSYKEAVLFIKIDGIYNQIHEYT